MLFDRIFNTELFQSNDWILRLDFVNCCGSRALEKVSWPFIHTRKEKEKSWDVGYDIIETKWPDKLQRDFKKSRSCGTLSVGWCHCQWFSLYLLDMQVLLTCLQTPPPANTSGNFVIAKSYRCKENDFEKQVQIPVPECTVLLFFLRLLFEKFLVHFLEFTHQQKSWFMLGKRLDRPLL